MNTPSNWHNEITIALTVDYATWSAELKSLSSPLWSSIPYNMDPNDIILIHCELRELSTSRWIDGGVAVVSIAYLTDRIGLIEPVLYDAIAAVEAAGYFKVQWSYLQ